jgi:hypothetical protein
MARALRIDPGTGLFLDDTAANADFLMKRTYREPWVVPEIT